MIEEKFDDFGLLQQAASPASAIQSLLTSGYNGGVSSWTAGQFLTSGSTSAGIPVTLGWIDNGSNVTVAATIAGDANCDGSVDLSDLNTLIGNYGKGTTWAQGDFRYTGTTSFSDLNALIGNYGQSGPVSSSVVIAGMGVSTVPEPSTLVLLGMGAMSLLSYAWRRRTKLHNLTSMILAAMVVLAAGSAQADVFNILRGRQVCSSLRWAIRATRRIQLPVLVRMVLARSLASTRWASMT